MKKPVLVCAADLAHLPAVKELLEASFEYRRARPATPENLARLLPEADAYFAALEVQLTEELISPAPRLQVIATPSTGLDHLDLTATAARDIAVIGLKDERSLLDRIITPHVGGITFESQAMAHEYTAKMLIEYFKKSETLTNHFEKNKP